MSYQPDPKFFNWGEQFQQGVQQSQDNKRRNALLDLEQRQFGLQENKFNAEQDASARSRKGRVAGLQYFGFSPEDAEQLADDEDFPALFAEITKGGSSEAPAAQRLAQWAANEATPDELQALQWTMRANAGKMADVGGVPTVVDTNLNKMPSFSRFAQPQTAPQGYPSGGGGVPTMDPYEPQAQSPVAQPPTQKPQAPSSGGGKPLSSLDKEVNAKAALAAGSEAGKAVVARMDEMYEDAQSGVSERQSIAEARKLLDDGIIAGTAGNIRLGFGRALATAGIGSGSEVARTDAYLAATAGLVAKVIKEFGAGTGLSDADREYAAKMAAGQIQLTQESMRKILEIRDKVAVARIGRYNKHREKVISNKGYEIVGDLYDMIDTDNQQVSPQQNDNWQDL